MSPLQFYRREAGAYKHKRRVRFEQVENFIAEALKFLGLVLLFAIFLAWLFLPVGQPLH